MAAEHSAMVIGVCGYDSFPVRGAKEGPEDLQKCDLRARVDR